MAPPNLRQVVRYLRETVSLAPYGLKRAAATPQVLAEPLTQGCQKKLRHFSGSRVSRMRL
jgi:DNA-binding transcriptional regulator YiaG